MHAVGNNYYIPKLFIIFTLVIYLNIYSLYLLYHSILSTSSYNHYIIRHSKNRFYFESVGRTFFGSGNEYTFRNAADNNDIVVISNDGNLNLNGISGGNNAKKKFT